MTKSARTRFLVTMLILVATPGLAIDLPPQLDSFVVVTPAVDPSVGDAIAVFSASVSDAGPGVCLSACEDGGTPSQVHLIHPPSGQRLVAFFAPDPVLPLARAEATFSPAHAAGTWQVESVWLADLSGNRSVLTTEDLVVAGFDSTLDNVAAGGSTTPPPLTSLLRTNPIIDSTAGAQVAVTLEPYGGLCVHPTCDVAGGASQVRYVHLASGQTRTALVRSETDLSGFPVISRDYVARVEFPPGSAAGSWTIESVDLVDAVGNRSRFDAAALAGLGSTGVLNTTTTGDTSPPSQQLVDWLPRPIDSTSGPVTVLFGVGAQDPGTGLCLDADTCGDLGTASQVVFQRDGVAHRRFGRLSDLGDDVYAAGMTIPASGAADVWRPAAVMLVDQAGNRFVPEPGTGTGLLIGLLGLAGWSSRRA